MFLDEMEAIDRGMAVDQPFSRLARSTGISRGPMGYTPDAKREKDFVNPARGRRNAAAHLDPKDGKPWWQHGRIWESRNKKESA